MYSDQKIIKKRKSVQIPCRISRDYSPTQYQRYSHVQNDFLGVEHPKQTKNLRYTFSAKTLKYLDIVQTSPMKQQRQYFIQKKNSFQNLRLAVLELENKLHQANNQMFKKKSTNINININGINNNTINTNNNNKLLKTKQKSTVGFRNNQFHPFNNNINMNNNINTNINTNNNMNTNKNYLNFNNNYNNHLLTSSLRPSTNLPTMRPNTQYEHINYQDQQIKQRQFNNERQFNFYTQTFCNEEKQKIKQKQKRRQSISTEETNQFNKPVANNNINNNNINNNNNNNDAYSNRQPKPATKISQYITQQPMPLHFQQSHINPYIISSQDKNLYYLNQILRASNQKNSLAIQHINASIKMIKCCILQRNKMECFVEKNKQQNQNVFNKKYYQSDQFKNMFKMQRLEKNWNKKTLVLDLDQTLIHCYQDLAINTDIKLKIDIEDEKIQVGVNIRPYALSFLKRMSKKYQIVIFTASHQDYANVILDQLDPDNQIFSHRFYRQHCVVLSNELHVKDLSYLPRDLKNVVLVDNAAYSYSFQLDNGIPILPFYEGKDYQLIALEKYLEKLIDASDVRDINRKYFKLNQYTEFQTAEELVRQIYMNPARKYWPK